MLLTLLPRFVGSTPWASSISIDAELPIAAAVAVIEPSASLTWIFRSDVTEEAVLVWTVLTLLAPPSVAENELPMAAAVRETSSVTA